ncbi:hypothetical protein UPYG_G00157460 [Umbra pygmaea]|uniref:Uncharacterized protein n=1 Tax=Umbra pygmaea TaxID=75934 RepID=A0ABD0XEK3_UMBPY
MEVSRRRILHKHLQPARPLRRCTTATQETMPCGEDDKPVCNIGVEQLFKILQLQTHPPHKVSTTAKVRISYSRDFLIELATSPMARRKPDFLPDHPVVLETARDPAVPLFETKFDNMFA